MAGFCYVAEGVLDEAVCGDGGQAGCSVDVVAGVVEVDADDSVEAGLQFGAVGGEFLSEFDEGLEGEVVVGDCPESGVDDVHAFSIHTPTLPCGDFGSKVVGYLHPHVGAIIGYVAYVM